MTDVKSKEDRSLNMSRIKGENTTPEMLVRKFLFSKGFRYHLHKKDLPGKPDLVLPKYRTVIFVNGCFWHAHQNCPSFVWPKQNQEFWKKKISSNICRDQKNMELLEKLNWKVIIVWECQLSNKQKREQTLELLADQILINTPELEAPVF
ncbi:MAG: very short patch repair endonuclease [Anaerolineaceae bacterium]